MSVLFWTRDFLGNVQCSMRLGFCFVDHRWLSGNSKYSESPGHWSNFDSYAYFEKISFIRRRLISVLSFQAFSGCMDIFSEKMVSIGVFTLGVALMSSSKRGNPKVTFLALFPAL